jgi:opacity protein-like surface antigen
VIREKENVMKKVFSAFVVLFALLMFPGISSAANIGPYFSVQVGGTFLMDSDMSDAYVDATTQFDPGFASGFAAGFNFGMFRAEGEVGYQRNDVDKISGYDYELDEYFSGLGSGNMTAYSFLANVYMDFHNGSPVTPFITAGIGTATIEINDFGYDNYEDTVFAYQVGAGLAFAINPHLTVDLKYRYFATDDPDFEGLSAKFASHNVYCGFRLNF